VLGQEVEALRRAMELARREADAEAAAAAADLVRGVAWRGVRAFTLSVVVFVRCFVRSFARSLVFCPPLAR
jgi:hypothetical protein